MGGHAWRKKFFSGFINPLSFCTVEIMTFTWPPIIPTEIHNFQPKGLNLQQMQKTHQEMVELSKIRQEKPKLALKVLKRREKLRIISHELLSTTPWPQFPGVFSVLKPKRDFFLWNPHVFVFYFKLYPISSKITNFHYSSLPRKSFLTVFKADIHIGFRVKNQCILTLRPTGA